MSKAFPPLCDEGIARRLASSMFAFRHARVKTGAPTFAQKTSRALRPFGANRRGPGPAETAAHGRAFLFSTFVEPICQL